MSLSMPLTFNEGVFLVPVSDLAEEVRERLAAEEGSYALTRPQGRTGSKIVDPETAELVERFRRPRTLVEAVILYSRAREAVPQEVLEEAVPLIQSLVAAGYLVPLPEGEQAPVAGAALASRWQVGDALLAGRVERVLQVLDDTELYLVRRGDDAWRVVKIVRGDAASRQRQNAVLVHEGEVFAALSGPPAPTLFARGEIDGLAYLEMEHVAGAGLEAEAAAAREAVAAGDRSGSLRLAAAVADAYARLHARGVVHGDVHPRNLLVERDGTVRLVDFGWARRLDAAGASGEAAAELGRGGVPFFYEPELARAFLHGGPPPPATPAGEQYAVAALLYLLLTGAHPRDYSLGRDEMLTEIATLPPLPFRERGVDSWPEVEAVLARALAKEPEARHGSMQDLAAALAALAQAEAARTSRPAPPLAGGGGPDALVERSLAAAGVEGDWLAGDLAAPSASVTYGAAGVALGLLGIALARGDGRCLGLAEVWLERARRQIGQDEGFYNAEIDIRRETVGESSPYHSESGIHAVAASLARARGDLEAQRSAVTAFLAACERPSAGLDLTLGRSAGLLGAAIVLDAAADPLEREISSLRAFGDEQLTTIWSELDRKPSIVEADVEYLAIAHGWAGFLYATLAWCRVSGTPVPAGVERRCAELADLAVADGRGSTWPWTLTGEGRRSSMPGWCNGSCGYVFLWTLAHGWSGDPRHLDLAVGAAWDAWDAPDLALSLCCGLAGRGYALLNLHRHTGDGVWLERAKALAVRGARRGAAQMDAPHSLYKGELGLALLVADLHRPLSARMPLFEPAGYRSPLEPA